MTQTRAVRIPPTSGPVEYNGEGIVCSQYGDICKMVKTLKPNEMHANGWLIAEAFNVHAETGMTPRELVDKNEALAAETRMANLEGSDMRRAFKLQAKRAEEAEALNAELLIILQNVRNTEYSGLEDGAEKTYQRDNNRRLVDAIIARAEKVRG